MLVGISEVLGIYTLVFVVLIYIIKLYIRKLLSSDQNLVQIFNSLVDVRLLDVAQCHIKVQEVLVLKLQGKCHIGGGHTVSNVVLLLMLW